MWCGAGSRSTGPCSRTGPLGRGTICRSAPSPRCHFYAETRVTHVEAYLLINDDLHFTSRKEEDGNFLRPRQFSREDKAKPVKTHLVMAFLPLITLVSQ